MSGQFINSPALIGRRYSSIADYPGDQPIAQDGDRLVYKGKRKVYLVVNDVVVDFYDWDIYGSDYRYTQKRARTAWGIHWAIA